MSREVAVSLLLSSASLHPGSSPFGWDFSWGEPQILTSLGGELGWAPGHSHHQDQEGVSDKLLPVGKCEPQSRAQGMA